MRKILGYIIYPPICFLVIGLIYWLFGLLSNWLFSRGFIFWLIVLLFFLAFIILAWKIFSGFSDALLNIISLISPNSIYNFWWVVAISIINAGFSIYSGWTAGITVVASIVYTFLVFLLTCAVIGSAGSIVDRTRDKKEYSR